MTVPSDIQELPVLCHSKFHFHFHSKWTFPQNKLEVSINRSWRSPSGYTPTPLPFIATLRRPPATQADQLTLHQRLPHGSYFDFNKSSIQVLITNLELWRICHQWCNTLYNIIPQATQAVVGVWRVFDLIRVWVGIWITYINNVSNTQIK